MKTRLTLSAVTVLLALAAVPAAGSVVFENYPINGTINAYAIDEGDVVSDSFTLSSAVTIDGVNFGLWLFPGDSISSVDWSIGTTVDGSDQGSGTASVSVLSTIDNPNLDDYDVYSDTFSFTPISLGPGTYYLSLQNASVTNGDAAFWDENDGANITAWANGASLAGCDVAGSTCAESFEILGSTTPEPGTLALCGIGLALAGALRRKAR